MLDVLTLYAAFEVESNLCPLSLHFILLPGMVYEVYVYGVVMWVNFVIYLTTIGSIFYLCSLYYFFILLLDTRTHLVLLCGIWCVSSHLSDNTIL